MAGAYLNRCALSGAPEGVPRRWSLAAWSCLVVTLASGVFLRIQWTGRLPPLFDTRFLIHAHSHLALLGWAFIGVFALVFAGSRPNPEAPGPGPARLAAEGTFLALVFFLFGAFLMQGYAFWSILLSMLHVCISLALVGLYVRRRRGSSDEVARPWLDLSMLWFVAAMLGPFLLAFGGRMGQGWVDAWVGYYLTLLFNGWLVFAAIGLLSQAGLLHPGPKVRIAMALGVLPTAVPPLMAWTEIPLGAWVGWAGALLFGGGLIVVGLRLLQTGLASWMAEQDSSSPAPLLASAAAAFLLCGGFMVVGTAPPIVSLVFATRDLFIGFIHLQLLALVSAVLVLLHYQRAPRFAVWAFLGGSWSMICVLLGAGLVQLLGRPIYVPLQELLAGTGALALAGAVLLPLAASGRAGRGVTCVTDTARGKGEISIPGGGIDPAPGS